MAGDDEILAAAVTGIEALNRRHAPDGNDRFYLFHRDRQWNPKEGVFMGWERKRGKIEELNRLLRIRDRHRVLASRSGTSRSSRRCATSSPWTPTRDCRGAPPGP